MTTWRQQVSDEIEKDFDELFDEAVEFGLTKGVSSGAILPFALVRDFSGSTQASVAADAESTPGESLPSLLSSETGNIRSAAFGFEVLGTGNSRALCVWLESRQASLQLVQGFEFTSANSVDLLELEASFNQPRIDWA